jgi:hypothetical protein
LYSNQPITMSPMPVPLECTFAVVLKRAESVVTPRQVSYEIYVQPYTTRFFTEKTLPPIVRLRLTMINSLPERPLKLDHELHEIDLYHAPSYVVEPEFMNIGWRVSETMYVIILTHDQLKSIRGINDSRKESKRES